MILLILLNVLYAWMFIIAKFALYTSKPVFMTAVRIMIGGLVSLIIYRYIKKSWQACYEDIHAITMTQWKLIIGLGISNIYFCNAFEFWGLQYLSAGKTAFIYNMSPFFAALLAYFVFSEKMTLQKWAGLLLGFFGFLPIFLEPSEIIDTTIKFGFVSLAEIALLIASVATVVGWTIVRILMRQKSFSSFLLNGISMIIGGLVCFAHAYLFESAPRVTPGTEWTFLGYVCAMAFSQNIVAYNLHAYLVTRYTTTFLTFFGFLSSILAALFGLILLHESISTNFIISTACVFAGLVIFYQEELRQGYINK